MIELIVKRDDREINRYFLPQGLTTLGRAEDNAIILDDSAVSRRHARIKVDGAKVSIEDMGSGNGTYFGDNRIEVQELVDGDEIVIEPFRLLLRKDKEGVVKDSTRPVPASRPPPMSRLDAPPSRVKRDPGGSAAGGPRLEVVRGQGGPYLLTGANSSIGRSEEATITLKDPSSSRKHASIERTDRGWVVADLGSANGTYVNGASIKEMDLQDGDIILIGNTELRFVDPVVSAMDDEPDAPPPPAATRPVPAARGGRRAPAPVSEMEMEMGMELGAPDAFEEEPPPPPPPRRGGAGAPRSARSARNGRDAAFEGGGALPQDAAPGGGTEVGAPPPSAFDDGMAAPAFGDAPTGYGDEAAYDPGYDQGFDQGYADGGYGMELGDDSLFPGGQQRPPDSLLGKYIFSLKTNRKTQILTAGVAVLFLIVIMGGGGGPKGGALGSSAAACLSGEALDKQQTLNLSTIERFETDIQVALAAEPKDYATAFERYNRIVNIGRTEAMANVCVAQDKQRIALESLFALHEFLVIQKLREVTVAASKKDAATEARIAKNLAIGKKALASATRYKSTSQYKRAIDAFEKVIEDDPGNPEVKPLLDTARKEYRVLIGEISEAQLAKLVEQCKGIYNQGIAQQGKRSASAYQQAIKTFERITRGVDRDARTPYYQQAQAAIAAAKRRLRGMASPFREQGRKYASTQDYLQARVAYRKAVATDPYDQTLQSELEAVQQECLRSARRQISEAKAYEAAYNYPEAMKSLTLALKYADQDRDKENRQAKEIVKRIARNTER